MDINCNKRKIINDPVLGFVNIRTELLYDLIQHPYVQRLSRIRQMGLSYLVYPGAQHTRFLHSIGAMHLMSESINQLRSKGNNISEKEEESALAAILLHDIGHGPFSHVLEHIFISDFEHEEMTLLLIQKINKELDGRLSEAIDIFTDRHPKHFLHQLVSGQLDMDRLDYLIRDSFFSGVREGSVGAERIIKMLNVKDEELVVEEKGIYSVENFLIARRLMYWQVYLHKTGVAAEKMLINIMRRAKQLRMNGMQLFAAPSLDYFLSHDINKETLLKDYNVIKHFIQMDDCDVLSSIKVWGDCDDFILKTLSQRFIDRRLYKVKISSQPFDDDELNNLSKQYQDKLHVDKTDFFFNCGPVHSKTYDTKSENINILFRDGSTKDISEVSEILNSTMLSSQPTKYYLCYLSI